MITSNDAGGKAVRIKCQVDLCDNVVTQREAHAVCKSCCKLAHKERKRIVFACKDTKLDLKGILQHPKVVNHCVQREFSRYIGQTMAKIRSGDHDAAALEVIAREGCYDLHRMNE